MTSDNLPLQPTSFVGREKELVEIADLLAAPDCRLLTLTGPGGIGKTRVAIEAARQFTVPDGVHFVPLQPLTSADFIISAIANTLNFSFLSEQDARTQLLDYLRPKGLLLVLDNFEHLLAGAGLLPEILETAPGVKLVVTSRERLHLREEWLFGLSGLALPEQDTDALPDDYSAVQLFVQHARRTGYVPQASDVTSIVHICRLVEGIPLAIELAAAWVRSMSCAELASEIENNLDVLTTNMRNVLEKHRSMRAAFEHSWKLLTEAEQAAFRRLSVFHGGFRREAGAEVSGASLLTLSALVDKSLLRMDGTGRYHLHELMRQYAEEQLNIAGEAGATRDGHSAYYLDFVAARETDIQGRRQLSALQEMGDDFDNIRAAWSRGLEQRAERAIEGAITALCCYGEFVSRNWQIEQLLAQAVAVFDPASGYPPGRLWARITARLLWISLLGSGEHNDIALTRIDRCLELADAYQDDDIASWSWTVKGMIHFWKADYQNALLAFQQSLNYAHKLEEDYSIAARLKWIGSCHRELSQFTPSLDCLQQSVRLHLEIGDKHGAGFALSQLAATLYQVGQYAEAQRHLEQALALHREIDCGKGIAWSMWIKSSWILNGGDLETAESLAQTVFKMATDLNHWDGKHHALSMLAYVNLIRGDYLQGQHFLDRMLSVKKDIPLPRTLMAIAAFGLNDFEGCRRYLAEHIHTVLKASHPTHLIFLAVAALLLAQESKTERAVELLGLAFHHPASRPKLLEKWPLLTRLRVDLEAGLGFERYRAAWEHGASLDLYAVSRDLLSEFNIPTDSIPATPSPRRPDLLSERELEILHLIVEGLNSREIAERLVLSVGTIRWYLKHIYNKIDVHSRSEAIARARELNLLA